MDKLRPGRTISEGGFAGWKEHQMDIEREPANRVGKAGLFHRK